MSAKKLLAISAVLVSGCVWLSNLGWFRRGGNSLLKDLGSGDDKMRKAARDKLREAKFTPRDLPDLYAAIRRPYPDDPDQFLSTRSRLLSILWKTHDRGTVDFIRDVYPSLPDNPDIRFSALRILSQMNTPESLRLLLDILVAQQPDLGHPYYYPLFLPLHGEGGKPQLLFPDLLSLLKNPNYRDQVYSLAVHCRAKGLVADAVLAEQREQVLADWHAADEARHAHPRDAEKFRAAVLLLEMIADYMACFRGDGEVTNLLTGALDDPAPRVALYAALSLITMGATVPEEAWRRIATDPSTRLDLYTLLIESGRAELFPREYLTQYYCAEADMVRWLCYPTELGEPPLAIELLATREVVWKRKRGRVYLFKYLSPDEEDGWMVGLSGPQPIDETRFVLSGSATFSSFKKLDEMSIDEHFDSFLK